MRLNYILSTAVASVLAAKIALNKDVQYQLENALAQSLSIMSSDDDAYAEISSLLRKLQSQARQLEEDVSEVPLQTSTAHETDTCPKEQMQQSGSSQQSSTAIEAAKVTTPQASNRYRALNLNLYDGYGNGYDYGYNHKTNAYDHFKQYETQNLILPDLLGRQDIPKYDLIANYQYIRVTPSSTLTTQYALDDVNGDIEVIGAAIERYQPTISNLMLQLPPSAENLIDSFIEGAQGGAWSANVIASLTAVDLAPVRPSIEFEFKVLESLCQISIQGLDNCVPIQGVADRTSADCGHVLEWFFVWNNGEQSLALSKGTNPQPIEVSSDTPINDIEHFFCHGSNTDLCTANLEDYYITAKTVTIYILRHSSYLPFMRVGIFAQGNPYLHAVKPEIGSAKTVKKPVYEKPEPPSPYGYNPYQEEIPSYEHYF